MLDQEFIRNALIAGSAIALASSAVGYFLVLRAQVFAADALGHVAFTGVVAAALAGIDLRLGLFAATVAVALLFAGLGDRARSDDVAIGVVFVWVLGLGALFLDLVNRGASGGNGLIASRALFGSIFGLSSGQSALAALIAVGLLAALALLARPLLFVTLDPFLAVTRGVHVRVVAAGFLAIVGVDAGEAAQAVGALLLLGMIAAPAGAAIRLTANPVWGIALAMSFGVASVWLGVIAAYLDPSLPPSSAIVAVAATIFALAFVVTAEPVRRALARG